MTAVKDVSPGGQAIGSARTTKRKDLSIRSLTWKLGTVGFFAPHFVFFLVFAILPLIVSTVMSFHNWSLLGSRTFIGVDNYVRIWQDERFWVAVKNTVVFAVISVPLTIVVGLVFANILNRPLYGKLWILMCFVAPTFFSSVGVLTTWAWIFSSTPQGLANHYLTSIGILEHAISWFETPARAWSVVILVTVWWIVGFSVLLYLGALQRVPKEQYEAATLDGASPTRQFFSITLPWIRSVLFFDVIRQVLLAFGLFDQVFFFTSGGPAGSTRTMVWFLYQTGFDRQSLGRAAAISWYIFLVVAVFGLINVLLLTKSVKNTEE